MGHIFVYSIESSLLLAAMYLAYKWALASERQHTFNRLVLWSIYAMALGLPLWGALRPAPPTDVTGVTVTVEAAGFAPMLTVVDEPATTSWLTLVMQIILWIYLAGAVVVMARTVMVAVRLAMIVRRGERQMIDGRKVVLIDDDGIAPFSVMRTIVMSRRDFAEAGDMIFEHERNHVRLNHWADLLMAQLVAIFQWYNPAAWLMREELKAVHEYQADAGVMASGINVKQYQMLLIKKAVGARFPSLANSLNHSKLKKRITMMYNSRDSRSRRLRALVLAPALGGALFVTNLPAVADVLDSASDAELVIADGKVSQNPAYEQPSPSIVQVVEPVEMAEPVQNDAVAEQNDDAAMQSVEMTAESAPKEETPKTEEVRGDVDKSEEMVFSVVEKAPEFPGGMSALMKFIAFNVRYPEQAHADSIQGRVVMQFVVGKDGKVRSPRVVRGVCESLDEEAIRVVNMLPDFIPGEVKGKPVAVEFTLPIMFKLTHKEDSKKKSEVSLKELKEQGVSFFVDGKQVDSIENIDPKTIKSIDVVNNNPDYPKGAVYVTLL